MYDDFADSFALHAEHSAYNAHYDRPAVLGLLGEVAGRTVLDVGCGSGLYAAALVERGADVIGFDGSAPLLQHARRRVGGTADLRVHDLRDPHRVLRPGGRLLEEPLPAPSMREHFPDTYDKLAGRPFFIAFVLAKAFSADARP